MNRADGRVCPCVRDTCNYCSLARHHQCADADVGAGADAGAGAGVGVGAGVGQGYWNRPLSLHAPPGAVCRVSEPPLSHLRATCQARLGAGLPSSQLLRGQGGKGEIEHAHHSLECRNWVEECCGGLLFRNQQTKPRIGPRGGYLPLVTSLVAFLPFHPATACTLTSRLSHATPCRPSRHGTGRRPSPLPVFNRLGPDFQTFPPLGASCIGRKRASEDNSYLAYCIRRGPPKKTKKRETARRAL